LPLYLQQVKGISASQSGVTVLPLTLGLLIGAISSGILARKIGRYKGILLGGVLWLLAMFLVLHFVLAVDTPLWLAVILFTLLGLGLGPMQSLLQIAGQNDLPLSRLGSGTAASQFVRQIGSTIGIALLGTILSSTIAHDVCRALPSSASCQPGAAAAPRNQNQSIAALDGQFRALEAQVTAAIKGDPKAYASMQGNSGIPDAFKKQIPAGGVPVAFQKVAIERATQGLEKIKITLETAFKDGITHAEQNIFLWGALFVLIAAGFIVALPNAELKGGAGGARGEGGPPAAAH